MASLNYTVYYGEYSLCSMMVRLTVRLRGSHKTHSSTAFTEKHIDISAKENITEDYLLNVNRKGQVPALTSTALAVPIADSLEITQYLMKEFPALSPANYDSKIEESLRKLHALNYYSLSYAGTNKFTQWLQGELKEILKGNISKEYRSAIEYNIEHEYVKGLSNSTVDEMVEQARVLLSEFSTLLPSGSKWMYGLPQPTALDAHLIPFLVRLKDVHRENLIPENLKSYIARAEEMDEWKDVQQGRSTYAPASRVEKW